MAKTFGNRIKVNTATAGTGTVTLGAASANNFCTFAEAGIADGATVTYVLEEGNDFEIGSGTYTAAGTTLSRDTVYISKISGVQGTTKMTLAGTATVRNVVSKEDVRVTTVSATAPSAPASGDLWYDLGTGICFIYVNDGNSSQWVEVGGGAGNVVTNGALEPINFSLAVSAASSALTISLKGANGADPDNSNIVYVPFRDASTAGTPTWLSVTAATSLVISSGSTLGVTSSKAFRLWVVAFNDGGTFRLGVINCVSVTSDPPTAVTIYPLTQWGVASSTAEGGAGAADSAGVFYTGAAVSSKAFTVLGFIEWSATGLTAGTWTTTNLNRIQLFGPGVHLPGQIIQTNYAITASPNFSITSTTYVSTGHTLAITPISAANIIYAQATGVLDKVTGVGEVWAQLSRGTTAATNLFGTIADIFDASGGAKYAILASLVGYDRPNTTSSQTYAVQAKESSASTSIWGLTGDNASFILQELMG